MEKEQSPTDYIRNPSNWSPRRGSILAYFERAVKEATLGIMICGYYHVFTLYWRLNHEFSSVPDNYLDGTIQFLKEYNKENIKPVQGILPFLITATSTVEIIFLVCERLNQPTEVRFLTLDLCDRFMMHHFLAVQQHLEESTQNRSCRRREWSSLKARLRKQSLLRLLSCIQIASKIVLNAKKLNARKVQRFLATAGHCYSLKSIVCSEQRIWKTIDFEIPLRTALTFVEVLLGCLRKKLSKELKDELRTSPPRPSLHGVCIAVLDVACLQRHELFHRFFQMATSRWEKTPDERIKFLEVEGDYILLASAVIVCSIPFWKNNSFLTTLVSEHLSQITNIPVKEVTGLATLVTQNILGRTTFDVAR